MKFVNNDQMKSFFKKEAQRLGISPAAAQSTYFSRLLLEKLAGTNYGSFVVKGSFSQFVHLQSLSRPVLDIDISTTKNHNIPLLVLFSTIYEQNDEVISYDLKRLPTVTPNGVYKIPVVATIKHFGDSKPFIQPITIDLKELNPVIFETQYKQVMPIFTGDQPFYINTPSFEEHIAEKLYIIAHNRRSDVLNTRVKDFYDIYQLHGGTYDPDKFAIYFQAMLMMYGEDLNNIDTSCLNRDFITQHAQMWERMKGKYEFTDRDLDLAEAVFYTRAVLSEQKQKFNNPFIRREAEKIVRSRSL